MRTVLFYSFACRDKVTHKVCLCEGGTQTLMNNFYIIPLSKIVADRKGNDCFAKIS